jgi:hypothetical protein
MSIETTELRHLKRGSRIKHQVLTQRGASVLYPDAWQPYLVHIPESERGDLLAAYYRCLTSEDPAVRLAAAKIWSGYEGANLKARA